MSKVRDRSPGETIGRLGEHIALMYLTQRGPVQFSHIGDFEQEGKPIEVKTTFEQTGAHPGHFRLSKHTHTQLCELNGQYLFILLRDDCWTSVRLFDAREIENWVGDTPVTWTHFFPWEQPNKKFDHKRCCATKFIEWCPLLSSRTMKIILARKAYYRSRRYFWH